MLNTDFPQYELLLNEPPLMKISRGKKQYVKTVTFRADDKQMKII